MPSPDAIPLPPDKRYELFEEIGRGGMASVHRGRCAALGREVALKMLHPHLADRPQAKARLLREAKVLAGLGHPHILEVYEYLPRSDGPDLLVTELVRGGSLRELLTAQPMAHPGLAALVAHRMADALECAHKAGIVHRDIKPENIMITARGTLKLTDFGVAQCVDDAALTGTGQLLGSPAYIAPEIIRGHKADPRADIFALGVLTYELATGQLPFCADNPHALLAKIANGAYTPASKACAAVDPELDEILARALHPDPTQRFASAGQMRSALNAYLSWSGLQSCDEALARCLTQGPDALCELDHRIHRALLAHVHKACAQRQHPRALALVAVLLESKTPCPPARNILQDLTRKTQRRQWLQRSVLGLGALGLGAFLVTWAAWPSPPTLAKLADLRPPSTQLWPAYTLANSPPQARSRQAPAIAAAAPPARAPIAPLAVRVQGLPIPLRPHYALHHPNTGQKVDLPLRPGATLKLRPAALKGWRLVSKRSPKDQPFVAKLQMDAKTCKDPKTPCLLLARTKPAKLRFESDPVSDEQLVVQCLSHCAPKDRGKRLARDFQRLKLEPGAIQQRVRLRFWASGYKTQERDFQLRPGPNALRVHLVPLEDPAQSAR